MLINSMVQDPIPYSLKKNDMMNFKPEIYQV